VMGAACADGAGRIEADGMDCEQVVRTRRRSAMRMQAG
jgi:hypothetical protein